MIPRSIDAVMMVLRRINTVATIQRIDNFMTIPRRIDTVTMVRRRVNAIVTIPGRIDTDAVRRERGSKVEAGL